MSEFRLLHITAVTPEGGKLSLPAADHGYSRKHITERGLFFEMEGGQFFVSEALLRARLAELPHLEAPPPAPTPPSPVALWMQASRKPERFEALLVKHGYMLPPAVVKRALIAPKPRKRRRR